MTKRSRLYEIISVALAIGALLLVLLVEGCATTPSPGAADTSTAATKPYGSLTIQVTFAQGGIDPNMAGSAPTFQPVGAAVFDTIVELTPEGQPRPGIAERWEISPDGKTHTFYIRKGVKFHDGSELTGADVKFSLERVLSAQSTHNDAPFWRSTIAGVSLKDNYTVVMQMKTPQFELIRGFGDYSGSAAVVPKKYIEEKGVDYFVKNPVGSGPWKVLSYVYGSRVDLEAFEDHWRAVPKFKNLTLLAVNEEATRVAMLKTGELDLGQVSPDSVPGLKTAGLRTLSYNGGSHYVLYLFYDLDHPELYPLGDVRVRRALSLALNRQEMGDQLYGGFGERSVLYMIPKTAYFFDPNVLKPDPFDPEGAKKLLAEAGYPNGFNMKLWNSGVGSETVLNTASAGYWRKVGVNAELVQRDAAAVASLRNPKLVPEAFNTSHGYVSVGSTFGFEKMITVYHSSTSIHNIRNPKLDDQIMKVLQTLDPAEKKKLALEAAVMAKAEYADIAVLHLNTILAIGPKLGGITTVAGMSANAYNFATITHAK